MKNKFNILGIIVGLVVGVVVAGLYFANTPSVAGSVATGEEYQATTTHAVSTNIRTLKVGFGSLAHVVITGDNTGLLTFYNATTSDATKRATSKATSTLIIADFPASTPEGTYIFDATFNDGLLLVTSGLAATSTVTWR